MNSRSLCFAHHASIIISVVVLTFLFQTLLPAQSVTWAPPVGPNNNELSVVRIVKGGDGTLYAACGEDGLLRSVDNGQTWSIPSGEVTALVGDVTIAPNGDLYIATPYRGAHRSTDQGITWTSLLPPVEFWTGGIIASASGALYGWRDSLLYVSTDQGSTWNSMSAPRANNTLKASYYRVHCGNNGELFCETLNSNQAISTNGGQTWFVPKTGEPVADKANNWSFGYNPASGTLYVVVAKTLYKSVDAGVSWTKVGKLQFKSKSRKSFPKIAFAFDANNRVFIGSGNQTALYDPSTGKITASPALEKQCDITTLSVTAKGMLLAGNRTRGIKMLESSAWSTAKAFFGNMGGRSIATGPDGGAYAVVASWPEKGDVVFKYNPEEETWDRFYPRRGSARWKRLWLVKGVSGKLYAFDENNATFTDMSTFKVQKLPKMIPQQSPHAAEMALAIDKDDNLYFASTWRRAQDTYTLLIFKSTDGGKRWQQLYALDGAGGVRQILFDSEGRMICSGTWGVYVETKPAGALSGELKRTLVRNCQAVAITSDGSVLAATSLGVYRSTDGAATWLPPDPDTKGMEMWALEAGANGFVIAGGWAIYEHSPVKISTDNGATWSNIKEGMLTDGDSTTISWLSFDAIYGVTIDHEGYLYALSTNKGIQRTQTALTGIAVKNKPQTPSRTISELPAAFALGQNYPNPFNPTTDVQFTIGLRAGVGDVQFVSLKVYNVLGQEVATLVNETKEPGTYTIRWDATGMPSGVYFYRLSAGAFSDEKRMVLMK